MDLEAALVPAIAKAFPVPRVATSTPNDLENQLPFVKVLDTGGSGDEYRLDQQGAEIDIFHDSKTDASELAWGVYHWLMRSLPPTLVDVTTGAIIGIRRVRSTSLPIETSYENTRIWRYSFSVSILSHDRS